MMHRMAHQGAAAPSLFARFRHRPPGGSRQLDLDVVRGLAIVLAMGWHFNGAQSDNPVYNALMTPGRLFGWAGVDLFFVLSGFLVGRLLLVEGTRSGRIDGKTFLVRRAFKLWPVLYVFLIAQLLLGDMKWSDFFFQTAFHVQNYTHGAISHLWSLAVEEHFYLVLVLALVAFAKWLTRPALLLAVLASVGAVCLVARAVATLVLAYRPVDLQTLTHFRVDSLAAGVALAVIAVHYPAVWSRLVCLKPLWLALLVCGIAWLCTVDKSSQLGSTIGYTITYITGGAVLLLAYGSSVILRFPRFWAPLARLGIYSYAVYIWHIAAGNLGTIVLGKLAPTLDAAPAITATRYVTAVLIAIVMSRLIEWPALAVRDRVYPSRTAEPQSERPRDTA